MLLVPTDENITFSEENHPADTNTSDLPPFSDDSQIAPQPYINHDTAHVSLNAMLGHLRNSSSMWMHYK